MDYCMTTLDGEPAVEWTWGGNDAMDPTQGRGWALLKGDEGPNPGRGSAYGAADGC
jgi:hypothetical protein